MAASKYLTPFKDDDRNDIIETMAYIQSLNDQIKSLNDKKKEAVQWLIGKVGFNPNEPGTTHYGDENNFFTFEVSRDYKVDSDKLEELVTQKQVSEETVEKVFRWKAEVNATEWKNLGNDAKEILAQAVTSKTSSPSIKINLTEE